MIEAVLFDLGGVMVAPRTGDWALPPGYADVLGANFPEKVEAFRRARAAFLPLIPDVYCVGGDDEAEYRQFQVYYGKVFAAMGFPASGEQVRELAHRQTFRDDRYVFFDDVMPYLQKWRARYRLGIVSDAPPSTRRIMRAAGVLPLMAGATFSCDLGVLKPDPRMYTSTLAQLGVRAERAVYIDDIPANVEGATRLGLRGIQMLRPMPAPYQRPAPWDGQTAESFAALNKLLAAL